MKFGGTWTEKKLDCLKQYVIAYEKVMKNQSFRLFYVDAFAGSGYRESGEDDRSIRNFLKGSPRIILENTQIFDKYIFIEKDQSTFQILKQLGDKFPSKNINFVNQDANTYVGDICQKTDWTGHRAILFLDPFAMEVKWATIKAIAESEAIDLWLLFPAMAVNRLLFKTQEIPQNMKNKLDRLFGTNKWAGDFYQQSSQLDLFDKNTKLEKRADFEEIKSFYLERLRTVFSGVADNPLPLKNSRGSTLFYLCFAVSNPKGKRPALRIAQHILGRQ